MTQSPSSINWQSVSQYASDNLGMDKYDDEFDPATMPRTAKPRPSGGKEVETVDATSPIAFESYCSQGDLAGVILQWAQGADVNRRQSIAGTSAPPLLWAALKGHVHVMKFLVDQGADVNLPTTDGQTSLMWAANESRVEAVKFLLEHDVEHTAKDVRGYTAATVCVQQESLTCLALIHETKGIDGTDVDAEKHTLLHWAAYRGAPHIIEYLIEIVKVPMNVADVHGRTPLHWSAREGHAEACVHLMKNGVNVHQKDTDGQTALEHATTRYHREATRVIERNTHELESHQVGTLHAMTRDKMFLCAALFGVAYVLLTSQIMLWVPPLFSYGAVGFYLMKNVIFSFAFNRPVRNTGGEVSIATELGMPKTLHGAFRGIGPMRLRDPSNLFAALTFLGVQFMIYQHTHFPLPKLYWPLMASTLALMVITKMTAYRSVIKPGTIKDSPVVKAVRDGQPQLVNKFTMYEEQHIRLPLRAKYCIETDCVIERFDSYSACLDCPVGLGNNNFFFLFLVSVMLQQIVIVICAWRYVNEEVCVLGIPSVVADIDAPHAPEASFSMIRFMQALLAHGLPCRHIVETTSWIEWVFPSRFNVGGVWLIQYAMCVACSTAVIILRQLNGIASGLTRAEMQDEFAPADNGDLVPLIRPSAMSIYSDGNACVNLIAFLVGRQGMRWRGLYSVPAPPRK